MMETIGKWFMPFAALFLIGNLLYGHAFKQGREAMRQEVLILLKEELKRSYYQDL